MTLGTTVYVAWYDFQKQTEHVCKGEVVDNELWAGTKQADMVNVSFQPPGMSGPIQHHFTADKLSEDATSVPHDDCYLVCGKKTRFFEHDASARLKNDRKLNASDAWQQVQQFKTDHWDYEHGHLQLEHLNEFYQLWHDAIAAKRGMMQQYTPQSTVKTEYPSTPAEAMKPIKRIVPDEKMEELKEKLKETFKEPTAREKRSTGTVAYKDSIQTSLFE